MNRLQIWSFGLAGAATFSVLYTLCALAFVFFPDGTIGFFNAWFHGLDLTLLKPPGGRALTLGQYVVGLVSAAAVSFTLAATFAGFYTLFARGSARV